MAAKSAPNLLFLMADDHAGYALGVDGNPIASTPNLDRLAKDGVRFANHFCNAPVCSPSRQAILTGRMPHAAGVLSNADRLASGIPTLPAQLARAGYAAAAIGVMHFNQPSEPGLHGFSTLAAEDVIDAQWRDRPYDAPPASVAVKPPWKPFRDPSRVWLNADALPFPRYERDMRSALIAARAEQFLEDNRTGPFALWVSLPEPHSPFDFPIEDAGVFSPDQFEAFVAADSDRDRIPLVFRDLSDADKRGIMAAYYASVRYLDRTIGRLLAKLDSLGLAGNTLTAYLPDHGYCLGQHGRFEKHCCCDPALRVPCLLRWPGRIAPSVVDDLTESADIAPTILDLFELPALPGAQGVSLAGRIAKGSGAPPHDFVFSQYPGNDEACVRTAEWKLIRSAGQHTRTDGYTASDPPGRSVRLYRLSTDPEEIEDVAARRPDTAMDLSAKMLERYRSTHPAAAKEPAGLTLDDAVDWYLTYR